MFDALIKQSFCFDNLKVHLADIFFDLNCYVAFPTSGNIINICTSNQLDVVYQKKVEYLMTMSVKTQKINVILTRIFSPTEFWIKIPTVDHSDESLCGSIDYDKQKTYRDYLHWIKGIF